MYQGIFDTDFDKYIEDAVAIFAKTGITTVFVEPRRISGGLEDERASGQSSSFANISARASWNTANIPT